MKTTIEITDALLREARKTASRQGLIVRALVERGLRHGVAESRQAPSFMLRRASFDGRGLQSDFRGASWEAICDAADRDFGRFPGVGVVNPLVGDMDA